MSRVVDVTNLAGVVADEPADAGSWPSCWRSAWRSPSVAQEKTDTVQADGRADLRRARIRGRARRRCAGSQTAPATRRSSRRRTPPAARTSFSHDPETAASESPGSGGAPDPARRVGPAGVDDYALSDDRSRLLIFTNSQARLATRTPAATTGCSTARAASCGSSAAMPRLVADARQVRAGRLTVAYVRENNIYVEDLRDGRITQLTNSNIARRDQRHVRLGLRGRVRPARRLPLEPGRQLDRLLATEHARAFANFRWSTTPTRSIRGSPGQVSQGRRDRTRPAGSASSRPPAERRDGSTVPGDPRDNYIAFMEWAGNVRARSFSSSSTGIRTRSASCSCGLHAHDQSAE